MCRQLEREGFWGYIPLSQKQTASLIWTKLQAAMREDTVLVSIMRKQRIGVIKISAQSANYVVHARSSSTLMRRSLRVKSLDVKEMKVDLISMSAHKAYSPQRHRRFVRSS